MSRQEFTGERYIPGQGGVQLAYEHLHRYLFALNLAQGKRVLDVASGSGYGAALLAGVAHRVWALDIDGPAVTLARKAFPAENLCFINADGGRLPFPDATVDMILAFEVIEHVTDQEGMIREFARVLKPGGLALISTPNKASYSDARQYANPFHVHEFYAEEFIGLLRRRFESVHFFQQQVRAGSLISGDNPQARRGEILTGPMPGGEGLETVPMYFLACCGNQILDRRPEDSAYFDPSDSLLIEWERRLTEAGTEIARVNEEIRRLGRWGQELESEVSKRDETLKKVLGEIQARDRTIVDLQELMAAEIASREEEIKLRDQSIRDLQGELERESVARDQIIRGLQEELSREIGRRDETIRKIEGEFEDRTRWARSLQEDVRVRDETLRRTNEALDATDESLKAVSAHLARIRHAFLYRVLCRLGILPR